MSRYAAHTDEQLVPLLNEGDRAAFSAIYNRHFRLMFRYVYSFAKDAKLSEDIVQEIFFDLWQRHQSISIHSTVTKYLHRAAKHKVLDHIRSQAIRAGYAADLAAVMSSHSNNVDELMAVSDLQGTIEKSISALPPRQQMAFRLSRFEHVPIPEIAKRMQISPNTVQDYLTKTLAHLRMSLGEFMVVVWWLENLPGN
jgi:RNA polymerase sigma-70 factor (ECF subfamily)